MKCPSQNVKEKILRHVLWLLKNRIKVEKGAWKYRPDFWTRATFVILAVELASFLTTKDREEIHNLVHSAICNLALKGSDGLAWGDVVQAVQDAEKEARRGRPLAFQIVVPLHMKADWLERKRVIRVGGDKFKKWSWERVQNLPGWEGFIQRDLRFPTRGTPPVKGFGELQRLFTPFVLESRGTSAIQAFTNTERAAITFRAVFNFVARKGQTQEQYGQPKPLSLILPPPVYPIFSGAGEYENFFYETDRFEYGRVVLSKAKWHEAEALFRFLGRRGFVQPMVRSLLSRYQEALDTTRWEVGYLSLWRGLEEIARKIGGDVSQSVTQLVRGSPDLKDLLQALATHRNEWVHTGRFPRYGLRELGLIKVVTESVVTTLVSLPSWVNEWDHLIEWAKAGALDKRRRGILLKALRSV